MKRQFSIKQRWLRLAIGILLAFVLLLTSVAPLFAASLIEERASLEDDLEDTRYQQSEAESELAYIQAEVQQTMAEIGELDKQLNECTLNITRLEDEQEMQKEKIEAANRDLKIAREDEQEHFAELKARLRMMYEYGQVNYLEVLFGSKSIGDFFNRVEYVNRMAEYDKQIQQNIAADRIRIQELANELQQTQLEMELTQKKLENEKVKLEETLEEKETTYEALQYSERTAAAYLEYLQIQANTIQNLINEKTRQINAESGGTPAYGSASFTWPCPSSYYISSQFGNRIHPIYGYERFHSGVDIGADYGEDILAADEGTVIWAGYDDGGYGYYVMITHPSGYTTLYGHSCELLVYTGQYVSRGQLIAYVGSTGASTGPHLHFEVRGNGTYYDPLSFFS